MKNIKSIFDIADQYKSFLFDINGIVTNGTKIFPNARDILIRLYQMGKEIIFMTNATRTEKMLGKQLNMKGIPGYLLKNIVTSGDVLRYHMKNRIGIFKKLDRKNNFYVIGNVRFLSNSGAYIVSDINKADYVLINGIISNVTIDDDDFLHKALARNIPFICTNPDKTALSGELMEKTNYATALYEKMGGKVYAYGKPYNAIYERIFELFPMEKKYILCVGDTLLTDIKGANYNQLDSLLVTNSIAPRMKALECSLSDMCALSKAIPTYYIDELI